MTRKETIRLIALPLSKHPKPLIYYYAQRIPSDQNHHQHHHESSSLSPSTLIRKLTDTSAKHWNKLAHSTHGSWKLKIYDFGERMMDKIPFEEWALKSIDPAIIPSFSTPLPGEPMKEDRKRILNNEKQIQTQIQTQTQNSNIPLKIELLYPGSICVEKELMNGLSRSMIERAPYHRRWMKLNIFLSPLTLPFAIVPLIPNLPFFYMMWRAWSHWRAYRASSYLNHMIERGYVLPISSPILNQVYDKSKKYDEDREGLRRGTDEAFLPEIKIINQQFSNDGLLLSPKMLNKLQERLNLSPESVMEIFRGIQQAQNRLENVGMTKFTSSND